MSVHGAPWEKKDKWAHFPDYHVPSGCADVTAAAVHALCLLCGHALYWVRMHAEHRQHSIRTGLGGTAAGTSAEAPLRGNLVWAIMQVLPSATSSTVNFVYETGDGNG